MLPPTNNRAYPQEMFPHIYSVIRDNTGSCNGNFLFIWGDSVISTQAYTSELLGNIVSRTFHMHIIKIESKSMEYGTW